MMRSILTIATLVCATLLVSCRDAPSPPPPPARPIMDGNALRFPAGHPQLSSLGIVVADRPEPIDIEMPARVTWDEDRTQRIYPAFSGRVARIKADIGMRVTAGQVLVDLASPEFGLAQTEAARARTELAQAKRQLDRIRDLHGLGIAARKELEQAETDTQRAQVELERAQARIRLYGGTETVDQQLAITAGVSGVVIERNVNPGQELRPEQYGPGSVALFVLTNPDTLWLQIDVRESHLALLAPGRAIEFIAHAYPDRRFQARVLAIGDAIDPVTRTLKVRAGIANADRLLKVEMLGKVRVSQPLDDGVVVPSSAVFGQRNTHWVYVSPSPGIFEPRAVKVAYIGTDRVLVREGLRAGERVVVENTLLLARMYSSVRDASEHSAQAGKGQAR